MHLAICSCGYMVGKKIEMHLCQGIDLVKIDRVRRIYNKFNDRFLLKVFSTREIDQIKKSKENQITKMAGKFSCKEAASKALGKGMSNGITFKNFEIINDKYGKPILYLHGKVNKNIKDIISSNVSISHDGEYLVAIVTLILKNR